MRYLVISDIHGNLEALEAVLADAAEYDAVLCLGDLIGYGPNPNEVVDRVRELPNLTSLVGNHDLAALGRLDLDAFNSYARFAAEWTDRQLRGDVRAWLESLKPKGEIPDVFLAHASPCDPIWEYLEVESQGPANFRAFQGPVCLVGHTHVPRTFAEQQNRSAQRISVRLPIPGETINLADQSRRIVNPGGVGQPRDGDPRAAYGILDADTGSFTFCRIPYAIPTTQRKIREAGLPAALGERLSYGL
jgi:diadenosine tetraphosphatase ApaH/serine/threonine PP2A family protein phosphatase